MVNELATTPKTRLPALITERLDSLGPSERCAHLKLATAMIKRRDSPYLAGRVRGPGPNGNATRI